MGIQHKDAGVGHRHSPYNWVVADATEKDAITPLAEDQYKLAYQSDTGETWVLSNHSPVTWKHVSPYEAAGAVATHEQAADPHSQYVQKVTGKGLSTEDYTTAEKENLMNLELMMAMGV